MSEVVNQGTIHVVEHQIPEKMVAVPLPKTEKQLAKEKKQSEQYWNSMITRRECADMIKGAVEQETDRISGILQERMTLLYIQIKTLSEYIKSTGVTEEQLNEISKPIIAELFPSPVKADDELQSKS
jgi:DNA-binding NtrC family response regulator